MTKRATRKKVRSEFHAKETFRPGYCRYCQKRLNPKSPNVVRSDAGTFIKCCGERWQQWAPPK